jgi:DNA-binding MarR family transcriptional regulator
LSRLVAELEERKLIRRQRDASDQRRVIVEATALGQGLIARLQPAFQAAYGEVFGRLTHAEKTTLAALLTKLAGEQP